MKTKLLIASMLLASGATAQVVKDYDPAIQRTTAIQYFKPTEKHLFTGDCMPCYHEGTFYLYWLLDEGHHAGLGGLGGHQWALSTSADLVNWTHHPVAVAIDEEWEKSICTGSVIADKERFYAFYSTRVKDAKGVHEQLSYARRGCRPITASASSSSRRATTTRPGSSSGVTTAITADTRSSSTPTSRACSSTIRESIRSGGSTRR